MVKYSTEAANPAKSAQARGSHLRVHFKHCREVAGAIRGMELGKAIRYLEDVLKQKQAIPFTRFNGGVGRHAQAKLRGVPGSQVRWPQKATKYFLDLLRNAQSNAEGKDLQATNMIVSHVQANQAPAGRRRTYRAHGRIGPYKSSPAHIEMILTQRAKKVKKPTKAAEAPRKLTRKQAAQRRLKQGGGAATSTGAAVPV